MPNTRTSVLILAAALVLPALLGAEPADPALLGPEPAEPTRAPHPYAFMHGYRATRYLEAAVDIQKLGAAKGAARLKEIAVDPTRGSEAFVLCRMLFEAKAGAEFRRPWIGAPVFVDRGEIRGWPLEPITLRDDVPILVVAGYSLAGLAESPASYVDYCAKECRWRDVKYSVPDKARVRKVIDEFIASDPKLKDEAAWLRRQAE